MNKRRFTILQKALWLIALPLVYQALFIGVLLRRQQEHSEVQNWAVHTKDVIAETERLHRIAVATMADARGYVLTNNKIFRTNTAQSEKELEVQLGRLSALVNDNPRQVERIQRIASRGHDLMKYEEELVSAVDAGDRDSAIARVGNLHGHELLQLMIDELEEMRRIEQDLDDARMAELRKSNEAQNWLLLGGLATAILIGAGSVIIFSRSISRRLSVLMENTDRLARGEELAAVVSGRDEISELDQSFHSMVAELTRARQKEAVFHEVLRSRNEELTRANHELDAKSQENEMFVYSVSHDLRSPLVNLQGFSNELGLLRKDLKELFEGEFAGASRDRARAIVEHDIGESIHYIQTAVKRLSNIIDALLRLSRAGRVEYRPEVVNLRQVVDRIIEAMRTTITEREAAIEVKELPPVWADPTAIEQIFANLIGNAVNYLDPQRPGRIEIGSKPAAGAEAESHVIYYVADNGLGIADAHLPKIFAAFQRLHASAAPGEGIGLPLVRRMVQRHGGRIWVESREGEGSTFFISLPATREGSPLNSAPRKETIKSATVS